MRRRTLLAGAAVVALAGCTSEGSDAPMVDGTAHSREHWTLDLNEGQTIEVTVDIKERPHAYDIAHIDLETVADGAVEEWRLPFEDVKETYRYTAERDAEHTLKVFGVGEADVTVREVDDA